MFMQYVWYPRKTSIISDNIYQVLSTSEHEKRGESNMEESRETNKENHTQSSNLWLGLIFVIGGIVIILNQLDLLPFELNWWALFIMLPAGGFLSGAYERYRENENLFSMDVAFTALIGLFLTALSFSLLVGDSWDINWSLFWPLILIIIGLGMIFSRSQTE
jgi:hypothetical protein